MAKRDLVESDSKISYVAFVPGLEDFCRCELRSEGPDRWVCSYSSLPLKERNQDEQITDDRIREVAKALLRPAQIDGPRRSRAIRRSHHPTRTFQRCFPPSRALTGALSMHGAHAAYGSLTSGMK